jgi:ABC-type lipoprotein export system ATPase subunit
MSQAVLSALPPRWVRRPSAGRIVFRGRDLKTARERQRTAYPRDHVGTELADNPLAPEKALKPSG